MAKRLWGITFTVLVLVILGSLTFWFFQRNTMTPPEEQRGTQLVEMMPAEVKPNLVAPAPNLAIQPLEDTGDFFVETDEPDYQFLLVSDGGYVTVYKLPENELYEYTDVIMDILPAELQEEIRLGKYLQNEEELYNFLENYTS